MAAILTGTKAGLDISVVIPVYNEVQNVKPLYYSIKEVIEGLNKVFEIVFIDDGSNDGTCEVLKALADDEPNVKVIRFRRNYGQTAAMAAGFDHASGDIVVTLDGDMQNDPTDIPMLIDKLDDGYDVVSGWRKNRKDNVLIRNIPSIIANKIISKMTGTQLHDYGCSLKVYTKDIAKALSLYGEMHRFIPALASIEGANIVEVPVKHHARKFGESKYNILKTFKVVLDLITVVFFRKFITRPLHMFGRLGMLFFAIGSLAGFYLIIDKFIFGMDIGSRPLLILTVLLVMMGVQLISSGILAEIMIRTYYESQNKTIYRVREIYSKDE